MEVTGSKALLPTTIDEGPKGGGGWDEVSIQALLALCEPAPESASHSAEDGGGIRDMVLKLLINGPWSQEPPTIGIQGCCDGAAA
jgi:hypothetical protein